jgi:hypothetical protein
MPELPARIDAVERPPCRYCGAPAPQWVSTCGQCGRQIRPATPHSTKPDRLWEIVSAIVLFAVTNFVLLASLDSRSPASLPTLALRIFWDDRWWPHCVRACMLGPPFLAVFWKWYQLMHQADADYGQLWGAYVIAQFITWVACVVLCLAAGAVVILVVIFSLLTAAGR